MVWRLKVLYFERKKEGFKFIIDRWKFRLVKLIFPFHEEAMLCLGYKRLYFGYVNFVHVYFEKYILFTGWLTGSGMRSDWYESHPSVGRSRVRCGIGRYAGQENRIWASVKVKLIATNGNRRVRALSTVWVVSLGRYIIPSSDYTTIPFRSVNEPTKV
jgi:hypothetical protein